MSARISRRTLVGMGVVCAAVASWPVIERLSDRERAVSVLRRLGVEPARVGQDLTALGLRVNEESPGSLQRVRELADAESHGPFAPILVKATRTDAPRAPVVIDGWLLPDLVAGVAAAAALEGA